MALLPVRLLSLELQSRIQQVTPANPLYHRGASRVDDRTQQLASRLSFVTDLFFATPLLMFTFPFIPILMMLVHTVNGVSLAAFAGSAILHEQKRNTFDLISLLPSGKADAVWLLLCGMLHHVAAYKRLMYWAHYTRGIIPVSLCAFSVILLLNILDPRAKLLAYSVNGLFLLVIVPALFSVLFERDRILSMVTAVLVGMIVGLNGPKVSERRAITLFLVLQSIAYLVLWAWGNGVVRSLLGALSRQEGATPNWIWVQGTVFCLLVVVAYLGLRELLIWILWTIYKVRV